MSVGFVHRHCEQGALRGDAAGNQSDYASGTLTNVTCSAYFSYLRNQRIRTSTPTERISLRSNYFQRLEVVASFSYSDAEIEHAVGRIFQRSAHAHQHPRFPRHWDGRCKPNF